MRLWIERTTRHFCFSGVEDMNSPWLQPGVAGIPSNWGFSPNLKIKAVAKAQSRGRRYDPRLKPGAIHVLRVKYPVVRFYLQQYYQNLM